MSSHARTRLSRRTSCLPISQGGDHASKSTSVPAKAGCGRNGAKRQTKTTVCLSRLFSGLCWGSTGAGMEVTKCLKPPDSSHEFGDCASVQAATRVNAEQTSHDEGLVKGSHHRDIEKPHMTRAGQGVASRGHRKTSPVASASKVQAHLRDAARLRARSTSHAVAAD